MSPCTCTQISLSLSSSVQVRPEHICPKRSFTTRFNVITFRASFGHNHHMKRHRETTHNVPYVKRRTVIRQRETSETAVGGFMKTDADHKRINVIKDR